MSTGRICWELLACASVAACSDPLRQRDGDLIIEGYTISGQANGTDPATGEDLLCLFLIDFRFDSG